MKIFKHLFDKITLRQHYKKQFENLLFELIENKYQPETIATKKNIVFRDAKVEYKGPVYMFCERVNITGKTQLTFLNSLSIVGRKGGANKPE